MRAADRKLLAKLLCFIAAFAANDARDTNERLSLPFAQSALQFAHRLDLVTQAWQCATLRRYQPATNQLSTSYRPHCIVSTGWADL